MFVNNGEDQDQNLRNLVSKSENVYNNVIEALFENKILIDQSVANPEFFGANQCGTKCHNISTRCFP